MTVSDYERTLKSLLFSDSTPKLGLERISKLLEVIGNPQNAFRSFHVAGTNGKGSTCTFLNSLLRDRFDRVGLYTSPHLLCARERIQINSELISESLFTKAERVVANAAEQIGEKPTFFERVTAMAFWAFAEQGVSDAVIEVGLGGRLDSTNVINPVASVITRVDVDHRKFLGNTIEKIAFEKAGIIKPGIPVVTGWQDAGALDVIRQVASERGSSLEVVDNEYHGQLNLLGEHQKQNAALAVKAVREAGIELSDAQIANGLLNARWPARLEFVQSDPPILVDGAHNANGMRALVKFLGMQAQARFNIVIGATEDHDFEAIACEFEPIKSNINKFFVTKSRSPRAKAPEELVPALCKIAPYTLTRDVAAAMELAISEQSSALTVVTGSLYVAGEARSLFIEMPSDPELPQF